MNKIKQSKLHRFLTRAESPCTTCHLRTVLSTPPFPSPHLSDPSLQAPVPPFTPEPWLRGRSPRSPLCCRGSRFPSASRSPLPQPPHSASGPGGPAQLRGPSRPQSPRRFPPPPGRIPAGPFLRPLPLRLVKGDGGPAGEHGGSTTAPLKVSAPAPRMRAPGRRAPEVLRRRLRLLPAGAEWRP